MLVVGIDPGAQKTGFAWIREEGRKVTRSVMTIFASGGDRMRYPAYLRQLSLALFALKERPDAVAIEEPDRRTKWLRTEEDFPSIVHLEGIYAVSLGEVTRRWPAMRVFTWKTLVWRGMGSSKGKTMDRMWKKYGVAFETDDESDALGMADHALQLMRSSVSQRAVAALEPPTPPAAVKVIAAPAEVDLDS